MHQHNEDNEKRVLSMHILIITSNPPVSALQVSGTRIIVEDC